MTDGNPTGENTLGCHELVELVTDYLEETLDLHTREWFDEHLRECDGCANYLQQFRVTVATLGAIPEHAIEPVFRDRLLAAFRDTR